MRARSLGLATMAALMAASCTAGATAAGAAPGPGTFTAITTPSGASKTIRFHPPPSTTTLTVSGQASSDVTAVDIDCIFEPVGGPEVTTLATSVPVAGNAFSTVATIPQLLANCRLRAVPTGVDPAVDYLGAYSGPILYSWGLVPETDGSTTVGYQAGRDVRMASPSPPTPRRAVRP